MSIEGEVQALSADLKSQGEQVNALHRKVDVSAEIGRRIEAHIQTQNGQVAGIKEAQLRQEGAFTMLKWVVGVIVIPLLGTCAIIAAAVLALVIKGG